MGFTIVDKTKKALNSKSKAKKKSYEQDVELAAVAAGTDSGILPEMTLEKRPIKALKGLKKRPRQSEKEQINRVARSLSELGQAAPILIDISGEIIDGHVVVAALKSLGMEEVWCAVIDHLDEHQRQLLHITLNRLAECGDWDLDLLRPMLIELDEIGFDLEITGFTLPEIDILMSDGVIVEPGKAEDAPVEPPAEPVCIAGDLWHLGKHRLLCADACEPDAYATLLDGVEADAVFTDCPWNIPIEGFVSGLGKTKHADFKQGAGEMSRGEFKDFCDKFHQICADHLIEGAAFFSCIDHRSVDIIMAAGKQAGLRHMTTAVWNKGTGGMGAPYRSAHEFIVIFCKGKTFAVNNVQLGKHGRDRTTVWSYPGANRPGSSANKALALHPTPKPVEMVADALLDLTKRGARVLDPFLGSGTTILAAEKSGRRACGMEIDPAYVDVAIRRWETMTNKRAVHDATGLNFEDLAAQRLGGQDAPLAA